MNAGVEPARSSFLVDGTECVGYLYAASATGERPCIVMGHGFAGTQQGSIACTARDFAAAGFHVFTFDYRGFGESGGEPRQVISIRRQLADWRAAIEHARALPGVDPARIAIWGSSLAGGHVVAVAADVPNVAAVVAQVPFNGFPLRVEGMSRRGSAAILREAFADALAALRGRPRRYIPVVGGAGELAVMPTPEAQEVVERMHSDSWRNEVAPAVLLEMMVYRPSRHAKRVRVPLLVCLAGEDEQTPPRLGRRIADRAPFGELRRYPCSHFDFYREVVRRRVTADQISFLETHLVGLQRGESSQR